MANEIIVTNHGRERAEERFGMSEKKTSKIGKLAIERGRRAENFNRKNERKYMMKRKNNDSEPIVYNNICFIVKKDNVLITLYTLPTWFGKEKYDGKKLVKKPKKYSRMNDKLKAEDYIDLEEIPGFCRIRL